MAGVGPLRRGSVLRRNMGEETVLYDGRTGSVHALNPTASLVWELCDGKRSLEEIEGVVRLRFSTTDNDTIAEDIRRVVERFTDEGLLEEA